MVWGLELGMTSRFFQYLMQFHEVSAPERLGSTSGMSWSRETVGTLCRFLLSVSLGFRILGFRVWGGWPASHLILARYHCFRSLFLRNAARFYFGDISNETSNWILITEAATCCL